MKKALKSLSRIISLCLAVCCILCLSACMGNENPKETKSPSSSAASSNNNSVTPTDRADNSGNNDPATPTGDSPASTEHSHNYIDYKCAGCGVLQEGHLSDYLISYVQKNGTANGETISVDVTSGTVLYGLTYNTSGKYFFFSLVDSEYDDFLSIKFTNQKDTYEIAYLQGDETNGREVYGTVYAPDFTQNTPIAIDSYYGPDNERPNAAENARICTGLMLDFLGQFFATNNVGITLNDLGFVAY